PVPAPRAAAADCASAVIGYFSDDHEIQNRLIDQLAGARHSVQLIAPELRNDALVEALTRAAGRGVTVQVCLDRSADLPAETQLLLSHAGVVVLRPQAAGQIGQHLVVIDRQFVFLATADWTNPDPQPRPELALLVDSSGLASVFDGEFQRLTHAAPAAPDGYAFELSREHHVSPLFAPPQ
ncbi:MAG: phospholipase D-like domain-containing protein, partial [Planctomycetota bacterium]